MIIIIAMIGMTIGMMTVAAIKTMAGGGDRNPNGQRTGAVRSFGHRNDGDACCLSAYADLESLAQRAGCALARRTTRDIVA
ncbi:MAG TPA: hypothetical protein VL402_08110 [Xanthobacteraceae bacterium]|nr:hypothetical protein [Xanthobacteraceae bacterium]